MPGLQAGAPAFAQVRLQLSPTAPRYHRGATVGDADGSAPGLRVSELVGVLVRVGLSVAVPVLVGVPVAVAELDAPREMVAVGDVEGIMHRQIRRHEL